MAWANDELWVVNTKFSCLCTLDDQHSFVPRWRPPFISAYAAEDRCHLNALVMADGKPRYVTVFGTTDTMEGCSAGKNTDGCLIDVPSGEVVAGGLAMPHSPRIHDGKGLAAELGAWDGWCRLMCSAAGSRRWCNCRVTREAWR